MTITDFIVLKQFTIFDLIQLITGDIVHLCRASVATLCGQTRGWSIHRSSMRALQQEVSQWCPRQPALQTESWTKGIIFFSFCVFHLPILFFYFYFSSFFPVQCITSIFQYTLLLPSFLSYLFAYCNFSVQPEL